MIEPIHPLHRLCHTVVAHSVGAVGIAHARFCRSGEHSVGNHRTVGFHVVLAGAEAVHKVVWHFVIACHLRIDVAQLRLFHKLESHRRNAVEQRECVHLYGVVLINQTLLALYYVEFHFKGHLAAEVVEQSPELVGSVLEYVHGERAALLKQCHGRYESGQAKHMVAVQMTDKNMVKTRKFQLHATHLQLCALTTVNHIELVANVEHLARRHVAHSARCRPTTQYIQFKVCHIRAFIIN